MKEYGRKFSFFKTYKNLGEVLTDHKLASLGDAYVNFAFSLALSVIKGEPTGAKAKGRILSEAFKRAGLREFMPSRMTHHMLADAAEALIVYAWLCNHITLEETIEMLEKAEDSAKGFSQLLVTITDRIRF